MNLTERPDWHPRIQAIKALREHLGLGLKDAKDAIDAVVDYHWGPQERDYPLGPAPELELIRRDRCRNCNGLLYNSAGAIFCSAGCYDQRLRDVQAGNRKREIDREIATLVAKLADLRRERDEVGA